DLYVSSGDISDINLVRFQNDLDVLQSFIDNNKSLEGMQPLEIGTQAWSNMRLVSLDLSSHDLTYIPAKLCNIYSHLKDFDISDNAICPPYPKCITYLSQQETSSCSKFSCPDTYVGIDGGCYYQQDIAVLDDFSNSNTSLSGKQPLEIGDQKWNNGRLEQLILSGNQLTDVPESICSIYYNLSDFDISNNHICPSYPGCIENVGYQNTADCTQLTCADGYVAFDSQCYYYEDLRVLIDFT
ncbi:uncharacterized protein METZ01_LOCUS486698, partial [marine metagenome]